MNTTWSVRIERLPTQLLVGLDADEALRPQPVWVTLRLRGFTPACPRALADCIEYEPLCRWITDAWPVTPHCALLEQRLNQLLCEAFDLDPRIQEVQVELVKLRMRRGAVSVGIERCVSRPEFEAQRRHLHEQESLQHELHHPGGPAPAAPQQPSESTHDECLPA